MQVSNEDLLPVMLTKSKSTQPLEIQAKPNSLSTSSFLDKSPSDPPLKLIEEHHKAKMVFKKAGVDSQGDTISQSTTSHLKRSVDSYFPLDVAFKSYSSNRTLLFRLDIQEYQGVDEADLKQLLFHIISSDEKNGLMFTFDQCEYGTFGVYLKKAVKELIFAHEDMPAPQKTPLIPFLVVGMCLQKDGEEGKKRRGGVKREEVEKMVKVL